MYKDYKIVVHSAAGRRRYMQYLVPFVIAEPMVDVYEIWINTVNMADIEFFKGLAKLFPKIKLVWQPDKLWDGNLTINAFYKRCVDEDTIYVRLDDDIIWMERDAIRKMVEFRVDHPEYFLVMPLVINNSLSTYLLQQKNKIKLDKYYNANSFSPILWGSGKFASELHQWFIDNYLLPGHVEELHIGGCYPIAMNRFSINCIVFFGKDIKKFGGIVLDDEEEFISCRYPTSIGKACAWNGDTVISHFAFFTQRERLDKQNILQQYGDILVNEWKKDGVMDGIYQSIKKLIAGIDCNEEKLSKYPAPYQVVKHEKQKHGGLLHYIKRKYSKKKKDQLLNNNGNPFLNNN